VTIGIQTTRVLTITSAKKVLTYGVTQFFSLWLSISSSIPYCKLKFALASFKLSFCRSERAAFILQYMFQAFIAVYLLCAAIIVIRAFRRRSKVVGQSTEVKFIGFTPLWYTARCIGLILSLSLCGTLLNGQEQLYLPLVVSTSCWSRVGLLNDI